jgi:hypothetical protein
LPDFGVEGGKTDFRESWGRKSRLFHRRPAVIGLMKNIDPMGSELKTSPPQGLPAKPPLTTQGRLQIQIQTPEGERKKNPSTRLPPPGPGLLIEGWALQHLSHCLLNPGIFLENSGIV